MRNPMIRLFVVVALAATTAVSVPRVVTAADRKPNIVFILADDLGYRELGCFGQKLIKTPYLDKLAQQGMRLTQHYAGNAVCAPSRCVLMTGKHPGHAFVRDNREMKPEGQHPIPAEEVTIGERLQKLGYVTGAFGKWGLGGPGSTGDPIDQGFDRFYGYNCQRLAHSYYPEYLWSNKEKVMLDNHPPVPGGGRLPKGADPSDPHSYDAFKGADYAPDRISEQMLEFVKANKDKPFFLYYPTIIPHVALHVPDEELKPYLALGWNDPPYVGGRGYTPHYTPRAAYAAMITRMDRYIGNLLSLLDELGLADNTIVIFTSDNGTTHLHDEVDEVFFNSVGELRGLKGSLYEGGIREPTIVRWPGRTPAGTVSDYVSGFEDWTPTLMEIAGGKDAIPADTDGVSIVPTLTGKAQEPRPFFYREFTGYGAQQFIRVGDWKAIRQHMAHGNMHVELYNLAADPSEMYDVSADHPDIVKRLTNLMEAQHSKSTDFPLPGVDTPVKSKK
ncbi:MAG: sulfatase-like hydrolase/transferase [Phycisphaera sp.]|nr:sulfatase-like hydrolase/transferase [Phycisphaera sp.]